MITTRDKVPKAKAPIADLPLLGFAGPLRPILVTGAASLVPLIDATLADWPWVEAAPQPSRAADIRVFGDGARFRIEEGNPPRVTTDYSDAFDAAHGLCGALIAAYVAQDAGYLCLHAAAARIGRGLVALIGDSEAGKSSLAIQLVRLGCRLYGDDRLAVRLAAPRAGPGRAGAMVDQGIALGLAPKLRLPLPEEAGDAFAAFVAARGASWSDAQVQLRLGADEAARFGEAAPLAALVQLDRGADRAERLDPVTPGDMLRTLLRQGFAPGLPLDRRVTALGGLARHAPGFRLSFARSAEAAALLVARFSEPAASGADR